MGDTTRRSLPAVEDLPDHIGADAFDSRATESHIGCHDDWGASGRRVAAIPMAMSSAHRTRSTNSCDALVSKSWPLATATRQKSPSRVESTCAS